MISTPTDLISLSEAAERVFHIKPQSLRAAMSRGRYLEIRKWKVGREVFVSEAEAYEVMLKENLI